MSNLGRYRHGMQLNHRLNIQGTGRVIRKFGEASLLKHANGKHELIGGSAADIADANDWVSLFAHEIVLSRPGSRRVVGNESKTTGIIFRFQPRLTTPK
jgi:hypothetical protein